jgi:hypothetical protein
MNVLIFRIIDILLFPMLVLKLHFNLSIINLRNLLVSFYVCKELIVILLIFKQRKIVKPIKYSIFVDF